MLDKHTLELFYDQIEHNEWLRELLQDKLSVDEVISAVEEKYNFWKSFCAATKIPSPMLTNYGAVLEVLRSEEFIHK